MANHTKNWHDFLTANIPNEDFQVSGELPFLGTVQSILWIHLAYLAFVFKIGPWFMKNREPFQLKTVLMAYNAIQIIASASLAIILFYYLFIRNIYDFGCLEKLPINHPLKRTEVAVVYFAYLMKCFDLLDTIFFVLRKSYRQITFLHVYHHVLIAFSTYCYIRHYGYGGHAPSSGFFNAIVHVFMYTYYFVAAMKPDMKNSVWWKRHITEMQIIQFIIILIHQSWPVFVHCNCGYPKFWSFMIIPQSIFFLYLFSSFYKRTYYSKKFIQAPENGFVKAGQLTKKVL